MAYYRTQYQNYTPVAKYLSPSLIAGFCTAEEADQIVAHLRNYSGTYRLMTEMRDKYNGQNGFKQSGLSEKQWQIVRKNMQIETPTQPFTPVLFNDKPVDILITKNAAFNHFKKKLGMDYGIFTLRVHSIEDFTRSRGGNFYKLKLRVSPNADGNVSACRVCGKALTDHTSITTGIGPTCVRKIGATKAYKTDVKAFMVELKKVFDKVGITEIEIWDSNILEGLQPILAEVKKHIEKPTAKVDHISISTEHIQWIPKQKAFSIDSSMNKYTDVNRLYDVLKSESILYVNLVNPKTSNWVKFRKIHPAIELSSDKIVGWLFQPCERHPNVDSLIINY